MFFHKFYAAREAKKPAKAARPEAGDDSDASDASDAEIGAALLSAPFCYAVLHRHVGSGMSDANGAVASPVVRALHCFGVRSAF